jgi:hypothetical protein
MKEVRRLSTIFIAIAALSIIVMVMAQTETVVKGKNPAVGSTAPTAERARAPHVHGSWHFTGGTAVHYISGGTDYGDFDDTLLETSDAVSVPVDSDPATLTVTYNLDLADAGDTVDVLVDGTVEFTFDDSMNTGTPTDEEIDVTGYEGDDVVIGFHFTSDASGTGEGMAIHNVTVSGECEADIFTENFSTWPPSGWNIPSYSTYADWHQCNSYPSTAPSAGIGWDGSISGQQDWMLSPEIDCTDWTNVLCDYRYMSSFYYDLYQSYFLVYAYSADTGDYIYEYYGGQQYGDTQVTDWDVSSIFDGNEQNQVILGAMTNGSYYDYDWFVFDEIKVHAAGSVVSFDDPMDDDSNWDVIDGDYTNIQPSSFGTIKSLYH